MNELEKLDSIFALDDICGKYARAFIGTLLEECDMMAEKNVSPSKAHKYALLSDIMIQYANKRLREIHDETANEAKEDCIEALFCAMVSASKVEFNKGYEEFVLIINAAKKMVNDKADILRGKYEKKYNHACEVYSDFLEIKSKIEA